MNATIFLTVISGVLTYVLGQLVVKIVIDPVQDMKKTIGQVAHALIERANITSNPGVPAEDVINETSKLFRQLSSQLQSHLYLVPSYKVTAMVFRLPELQNVLTTSSHLIGLSNSLHRATDRIYEINAKRVEAIHDLLGIYMADGDRFPKDEP